MAKFLDKKERVIDFQLTPYGKHRLSIGQFKPYSYAFFDTGILYDTEYAGQKEIQTKVHERIKTETQFIEGILLFQEAENTTPRGEWGPSAPRYSLGGYRSVVPPADGSSVFSEWDGTRTGWSVAGPGFTLDDIRALPGFASTEGAALTDTEMLEELDEETGAPWLVEVTPSVSMFDIDYIPKRYIPKPEKLSFDSAIGNARFEGDNTQASPAWKIVTCQGEMSNIRERDTTNYNFTSASFDDEIMEWNIPQIDVDAYYTLLVSKPDALLAEERVSDFIAETRTFSDGNTIKLVRDDIVVYAEELNTELLTENFDIQVFEMTEPTKLETYSTATIGYVNTGGADTFTIDDGKTEVTFKIIDNTSAAKAAAEAEFEDSGVIGVVAALSAGSYHLNGVAGKNRYATIYNLMSAINGDTGGGGLTFDSDTLGYPTPSYNGSTADGTILTTGLNGRCKTIFNLGCYVGSHDLNVQVPIEVIRALVDHSFDGATIAAGGEPFEIKIINYNNLLMEPPINPNAPNATVTCKEGMADVILSGFSGGLAMHGIQLIQKYFKDENPQVVDGLMIAPRPEGVTQPDLTPDAVDYYFNVLTDKEVDGKIACSCASTFNKNSYYVDIDFDCVDPEFKEIYYDIYGSATSPEICDVPNDQISTIEELRLTDESEGCED